MGMIKIYLCHPARGDIEGNRMRTAAISKRFLLENRNHMVFVPHLAFSHFDDCLDRVHVMKCCLEMVSLCDRFLLCGDSFTEGMREEMMAWAARGKEMTHLPAYVLEEWLGELYDARYEKKCSGE